MGQNNSSHASPPSVRSPTSTKRAFSRLFKSSEQAVIDDADELAALEEAFRRSSISLLPLIPPPSCTTTSQALSFKGPIRLDFASGWEEGPVIEWYERHRRKGSTLIEKLQLRKDCQYPYFHEYIIVFTRGGHRYRVDRRPDPNASFDTIMRSGCEAYDTIQEVDSQLLKELENASDCVVELQSHGKRTINLSFVLSICFALQLDGRARQYTFQSYNCYLLSWAIIVIALRAMATWETRLSDVMSETFLHLDMGASYSMALARSLDTWILGQYLEQMKYNDWSPDHMELALALARIWLPERTLGRRYMGLSPDLTMALAQLGKLQPALDEAQMQAQVMAKAQELERLELELDREQESAQEPEQANLGWEHEGNAWARAHRRELTRTRVQELKRQLVGLMMEYIADSISVPLFSVTLRSTMLQNFGNCSLRTFLNEVSEELRLACEGLEVEAEELVQTTVSNLLVLPAPLSISLSHNKETTHGELEQYIMQALWNHARRIARLGLAPAAEVEENMFDGMNHIWLFVSKNHISMSHAYEGQT